MKFTSHIACFFIIHPTFASISFTTDYADFTDYFLQMDLSLHGFFLI